MPDPGVHERCVLKIGVRTVAAIYSEKRRRAAARHGQPAKLETSFAAVHRCPGRRAGAARMLMGEQITPRTVGRIGVVLASAALMVGGNRTTDRAAEARPRPVELDELAP